VSRKEAQAAQRGNALFVPLAPLRGNTRKETSMIYVIATIEVVEGKRDAFLDEFHKLVPKVHAEVGCLEYGPTVDVPTGLPPQVPLRDNAVTIVEKWESVEALETHLGQPHMAEYKEATKDLAKGVVLQVLTPA